MSEFLEHINAYDTQFPELLREEFERFIQGKGFDSDLRTELRKRAQQLFLEYIQERNSNSIDSTEMRTLVQGIIKILNEELEHSVLESQVQDLDDYQKLSDYDQRRNKRLN